MKPRGCWGWSTSIHSLSVTTLSTYLSSDGGHNKCRLMRAVIYQGLACARQRSRGSAYITTSKYRHASLSDRDAFWQKHHQAIASWWEHLRMCLHKPRQLGSVTQHRPLMPSDVGNTRYINYCLLLWLNIMTKITYRRKILLCAYGSKEIRDHHPQGGKAGQQAVWQPRQPRAPTSNHKQRTENELGMSCGFWIKACPSDIFPLARPHPTQTEPSARD